VEKTFDPEEYNMVFCPLCMGEGRLPRGADGFDVCTRCGGFELIEKGGVTNYVRLRILLVR
jgi:hypothetical protein